MLKKLSPLSLVPRNFLRGDLYFSKSLAIKYWKILNALIFIGAWLFAGSASATDVDADWWSNRTSATGVYEFHTNSEGLRLAEGFTAGVAEGSVSLPFSDTWTINFVAHTDESDVHETESIKTYINNVLVNETFNTPVNTIINFDHQITGSSFDYRFEFSSPSALYYEHMVMDAATVSSSAASTSVGVCSIFDGNTLGVTHTERIIDTEDTSTNQDLFGRSAVYFGGSTPSDLITAGNGGQVASVIEDNIIYDLTTSGSSITVSGNFYNRTASIPQPYNESYLGLFPSNAGLGNPLVGYPVIEREGIVLGTVPSNNRLIGAENRSNLLPGSLFFNTTNNPIAPDPDSWFELSATFTILNGSLVVSRFLIDGISSGNEPFELGPTNNYPWVNSLKAAIAVDDSASEMCVDYDVFGITVDPGTILVGDDSTLMSSGGQSTGSVTYSVDSGPCTVDTVGVVTGISAGICTVTGTKAGDANYDSATDTVTISVTLADQIGFSITANPTSIPVDDTSSLTPNGGQSNGSVTYSVDSGPCTVDVAGIVTGISVGTCMITGTKSGDANYNSATDTAVIIVTDATDSACEGKGKGHDKTQM